jgi:hypothetical protein
MPRRTIIITTALALCLLILAPRESAAQFNAYFFPVEKGSVETLAELQVHYSHLGEEAGPYSIDIDYLFLSAAAQYAIGGFLEVGLNIPFLMHVAATGGSAGGVLVYSGGDTEFGNIELALKGKVFSIGDFLSLAIFLNTYLPTHSGEGRHDFAILTPGAAISGEALGFTYGAALKLPWAIVGGNDDAFLMGIDFHGGYTLLGMFNLVLAFQYMNSLHPGTDASPIAIVPGVDVKLMKILRVGLACRVAINDQARFVYMGRASLLFHAGVGW